MTFDGLENELKAYINKEKQNDLREEINDFLTEENHDQPAKDFAEEAIKAKEESEDNEVDFDDTIIKTEDFTENECLNSILEELNYNDIAASYLSNFSADRPVAHLKFTTGVDSTYPSANAVTYEPVNYVI
jgi:hypothetical protein